MAELRKLIGHTFGSRLIQSATAFILSILIARWLGAEGKGLAALLVLNLSFSVMVQNLVGGGALVHLLPKYGWPVLKVFSLAWSILASALTGIIIYFWSNPILPFWALFLLGVLLNLSTLYQHVLLGFNKVKNANRMLLWQSLGLFFGVLIWYLIQGGFSLKAYAILLGIGYGVGLISGFIYVGKNYPAKAFQWKAFQDTLKLGLFSQAANIFQLGNYRLSYYFLEAYVNTATVGVYSLAVNLAEVLWLPARSMATVLYAKVSNQPELDQENIKTTLSLTRYSVLITSFGVLVLCMIPDSFHQWVFGEGFQGIQKTIWWLSPGIMALALSNNLSHYLNGQGKILQNTYASGLGLLATILGCTLLIPRFGLVGAAQTASLSYLTSCIFLMLRHRNLIKTD